ncbi:MAG TPA: Cys-tRNA(Pro) deacylase [Burkholderiales bacterium]|nr:Cys-tRNA(Pro) deacylase [Burkholderiales bacterium]
MAAKDKSPSTPAVLMLRSAGIEFTPHCYNYEEHGGTAVSSRELGVDEHQVVKTLIMEDDGARPLVVLMHGDRKVSTRELARVIGVKRIAPCDPETAQRHSGYMVGGTSPFGTRKAMPVYMEKSILDLPVIHINGGRRGFLVGIEPAAVARLLKPTLVEVAI